MLQARMFGAYRIRLNVLRGAPAAKSYRPRFEISAIKSYALLPSVFGFMALVVVAIIAAIGIGIAQLGARAG